MDSAIEVLQNLRATYRLGLLTNGAPTTQTIGRLGWSVAGVGDMNGDGKADVAVGAFWENRAYVVFGKSSERHRRPASSTPTR